MRSVIRRQRDPRKSSGGETLWKRVQRRSGLDPENQSQKTGAAKSQIFHVPPNSSLKMTEACAVAARTERAAVVLSIFAALTLNLALQCKREGKTEPNPRAKQPPFFFARVLSQCVCSLLCTKGATRCMGPMT